LQEGPIHRLGLLEEKGAFARADLQFEGLGQRGRIGAEPGAQV
jgi:hypothetical protein